MEKTFKFKKGKLSEDLVDTEMYDWLHESLLKYFKTGYAPSFREDVEVIIKVTPLSPTKNITKNNRK